MMLSRDKEADELGGEPVEQLHAICYPTATYHLKLALKQESLYDSRGPLVVAQDPTSLQSIAKIPTKVIQPLDCQPSRATTILPVNHPSITLSPTFICSVSDILLGFQWIPVNSCLLTLKNHPTSPLLIAVQKYFGLEIASSVINELPGWELYDNFLLFQSNGFQSPHFLKLLKDDTNGDQQEGEPRGNSQKKSSVEFYNIIANQFKVTHVARKGLIDRRDASRQPKLEPLHGRFRDEGYGYEQTTDESFNKVFWTSTRFKTGKGSIKYVWAPSETMYSRGNSKEKIRISSLTNVTSKIVVDMCCGIGFFSFAYLLAGASQVIACEISPWAVEALRRGAVANGYSYQMVTPEDDSDKPSLDSQLLIFHGRNELALPIYRHKATHVNLGLLPSSTEFLPQSVKALRPEGGWLHVHGEISLGGGQILRQKAADAWAEDLANQVISLGRQSARPINIHWVKSIGPSKEHIVVELEVGSSLSI